VVASHYAKPAAQQQAEAQGLNKPRAIAFGPDGSLYVVDSRNHRIEKRHSDGQALIARFGSQGTNDGQLREPCGIAVSKDGWVYVADTFYTLDPQGGLPWGRVQKFSPEGVFAGSFGRVNVDPKDLFGPRAVAVSPQGQVFLSDTGNHRVIKYDANGSVLKIWGKRGKGRGEFVEPFGLTFDAKGLLYVADRLNFRVQVFDAEGNYQREIKIDGWEESQINQEPYLAIDNKGGHLYVSDPTKRRVLRYNLTGGGKKEYTGGMDGAFNLPTGLAWRESDGVLLVSDGGLGRVLTLKP
jgi:sugar lactone lactonase YvrE